MSDRVDPYPTNIGITLDSATIALFGGSFDPPHHGHTQIVLHLYEVLHVSQVVVFPTGQHPWKHHGASFQHRFEMTRLMFEPFPWVTVSDSEAIPKKSIVGRGEYNSPRYTIDTVRSFLSSLNRQEKEQLVYWVLGGDCLPQLSTWKDVEVLFSLVLPLVVPRGCANVDTADIDALPLSQELKKKLHQGLVVSMPRIDINSTDVRSRIKKKLWTGHLLPQKVRDYILLHHLYQ